VLGFDGTMVINPHVSGKVPFDPVKDFAPISKIGDAALIIVTNPSLPVKTFAELVAYSKTHPGGVSFGSAGNGSTPHLAGELLNLRTGGKFVHIPYKGGGQAMADVVGGTLPMLYTAVAGAYPFVQKGQVNAIAVSSAQRLPSLPTVPTVAESGVPGFESSSWIGILAPAKTPQPVIDKLQREIHAVVHMPDIKERLSTLGITASGSTSADFAKQIEVDLKKYAEIVKLANVKAD
jgi:tripartite-type tricarboxylate transporter receptor subunit TctC